MMKKTLYWTAAAAILALVSSCAREEAFPSEGGNSIQVSLTATHENRTGTKTTLGDGGTILWTDGDQINVVYNGGNVSSEALSLTTEATSATFTATLPNDAVPAYAVYPAAVAAAYDGGTFTVTLPSTQDGTFAGATVEAAPVADGALAFKHLCGLLKISVNAAEVKGIRLTAYGGKALAGTAAITFADGIPSVGTVTAPSSSITLAADGAGDYYAAVLPTDFSEGFLVELLDDSNAVIGTKFTGKRFNLQRRDLANLGTISVTDLSGLFVTVNGAGSKDGSSWDDAMDWTGLVTKITGSALSGTIFMKEGTYPTANHTVKANSHFAIYGGYAAASTGTDLSQRDIENHATIFDGGGTKRLFVWNNSTSEDSFDGVTFQHAYMNSGDVGSALIINNIKSATFNNCKIKDNVKEGTGGGGAVRANKGNITFTNCSFTGNKATGNAGVMAVTSATLILDRCAFTGNTNEGDCSVIYCVNAAYNCTITDCYFADNQSKNKGVIALGYPTGKALINGCRFEGNSTGGYGSVLYNKSQTVVTNCAFEGNVNTGSDSPATLNNDTGKLLLVSNSVRLESATAAAFLSASTSGTETWIANNIFVNTAESGIALRTSSPVNSYGHNIYSALNEAVADTYVTEDATGHADTAYLLPLQWSGEEKMLYYGASDLPAGFVQATPDRLTAVVAAYDTANSTSFSSRLAGYLQADIRGHARSNTVLWPGCYED